MTGTDFENPAGLSAVVSFTAQSQAARHGDAIENINVVESR